MLAATAAGLAALANAAPASTPPLPAQKTALKAVQQALTAHRIDATEAAAARGEITRATHLVRTLPSGRREHVLVALSELAAFSGKLTLPRTLALVGQLKANDDYFAMHYAPGDKTDIVDADGLVYRYFSGRCLEFHPLANFGALNARVAAQDAAGAQRLADALMARGVYQAGGGVAWEYLFSFAGGHAPWISGMAQAVAAQAFARTAALVPDEGPAYLRAAHAAFRTIPQHLLTSVPAGPWIKLYSFDSLVVLNAQLQAVISLQSYADAADDPEAATLAARMQSAAAATLARFDTGYWSLYSLPGERSPLDYQQFVVSLLKRLGPTDPRFASAATRFDAYDHQPPAFQLENGGLGSLRFWLSKPASVTITSAAGPAKRISLGDGWHTIALSEPTRAGAYPVHVSSVDWAGNHASFDALPLVRAAATAPKAKRVRSTAAVRPAAPPPVSIGAGLTDPSQAAVAQRAGLRLVRFGVAWPTAATAPDPGLVTALQRVPPGLGVVVELGAAPADDVGRAALDQYAVSLVQQVPSIRDVLLAPAPATSGVAAYAATLNSLRGALVTAGLAVATGPLLDGALTPKTTAPALGRALATIGTAPYVDVIGFRPAAVAAKNLWTLDNLPALTAALTQSLGAAPPVLVDGLVATPAVAAAAITGAACSTALAGIVLDTLATDLSVTAAAAAAQRGTVVCPGLAAGVDPSTLQFPTELTPPAAAQVALGCSRDCLYLVTLIRADGTPVVATRGTLVGGAAPAAVVLPRTTLKPGSYSIDVRLVARVNPGLVTRQTSELLTVG
ncbi:MAG: hypothetical protein H0X39_05680 [Actinobacteria bacterium]|nr:hypothetical protein [Actinomycetota bacterium]